MGKLSVLLLLILASACSSKQLTDDEIVREATKFCEYDGNCILGYCVVYCQKHPENNTKLCHGLREFDK